MHWLGEGGWGGGRVLEGMGVRWVSGSGCCCGWEKGWRGEMRVSM